MHAGGQVQWLFLWLASRMLVVAARRKFFTPSPIGIRGTGRYKFSWNRWLLDGASVFVQRRSRFITDGFNVRQCSDATKLFKVSRLWVSSHTTVHFSRHFLAALHSEYICINTVWFFSYAFSSRHQFQTTFPSQLKFIYRTLIRSHS